MHHLILQCTQTVFNAQLSLRTLFYKKGILCPDLGYKLLGCLCPIPLRSSLKFKLHEAAAVATKNGKGSEASKVGPIAIWHRPAFAFSLNCDIRYMWESHNSCRFLGPQSHQFLSDPSHCNQQAYGQEAKGTPVSPLCRDRLYAAVGELDAIFGMMHAWGGHGSCI